MFYTYLICCYEELFAFSLSLSFFGCEKDANFQSETPATTPDAFLIIAYPEYTKFVWFENKKYNSVIGCFSTLYINSLISRGTLFTPDYAITHPSCPDYFDFFAEQNNSVTTNDCINTTTLTTAILYTQMKSVGESLHRISEGLPSHGSKVCTYGSYAEKHNPTTLFANISTSANKTFASFVV